MNINDLYTFFKSVKVELDTKQIGLHTMIFDYVAYSKNKLGL